MKKTVVRKMFRCAIVLTVFMCAIFLASCANTAGGGEGSSYSGTSNAGNTPASSGNGDRMDGGTSADEYQDRGSGADADEQGDSGQQDSGSDAGNDQTPSGSDQSDQDDTSDDEDAPEEMKPEDMEEKQSDEYDNIEENHKTDIVFADDLEGTEWSCKVGDFYQYLIFNDFDGFVAVFYGSGDSKEAAKLKAEESKNSFDTEFDMRNDDDCNIGYVSVEDGAIIKIALFPLFDDLSMMPSGYIYIEGGFYMSPSGQLIARPANESGDETDFKIGFVKEN